MFIKDRKNGDEENELSTTNWVQRIEYNEFGNKRI